MAVPGQHAQQPQRQTHPPPAPVLPNTFTYAGPSATYQHPTVVTPLSQESAMEERLLIGSDLDSD